MIITSRVRRFPGRLMFSDKIDYPTNLLNIFLRFGDLDFLARFDESLLDMVLHGFQGGLLL